MQLHTDLLCKAVDQPTSGKKGFWGAQYLPRQPRCMAARMEIAQL